MRVATSRLTLLKARPLPEATDPSKSESHNHFRFPQSLSIAKPRSLGECSATGARWRAVFQTQSPQLVTLESTLAHVYRFLIERIAGLVCTSKTTIADRLVASDWTAQSLLSKGRTKNVAVIGEGAITQVS